MLIEVSTKIRLHRALDREDKQEHPKYDEMCRRFLADEEDFSEDKIDAADVTRRFNNDGTIEECIEAIRQFIRENC